MSDLFKSKNKYIEKYGPTISTLPFTGMASKPKNSYLQELGGGGIVAEQPTDYIRKAADKFDPVERLQALRSQSNQAPDYGTPNNPASSGQVRADQPPSGPAAPAGSLQRIVQDIARQYGWDSGGEWNALVELVNRESSWNNTAQNPTSTAYGLFQFLDSTWGGYGVAKTSNPTQQAIAGLRYIQARYGSPTAAVQFHDAHNWY